MHPAVRKIGRQALLRVARTRPVARLLRFYENEGMVDPTALNVAAPAAHDNVERLRRELWDKFVSHFPPPAFEDLTEDLADDTLPSLDRPGVDLSTLTEDQRHWWQHGFLLKRGLIPDELVDAYREVRARLDKPHGWESTAPYLHISEIRDLGCYGPLSDKLEELIGEKMGMSLNLTGWLSTERNWHQDDYLNPPEVKGWYAAVWVALDTIDPDSGPFQFVPGSHRWPVLRRERVRMFLTPEERAHHDWPRKTERFLDELLEKEIAERGAAPQSFLGEKGDVLIWHSRLVHRGSPPKVPGTPRLSFIAHYTGKSHWPLDQRMARHGDGGYYFRGDIPLS
ncbi:MAG: phytanoyl-CoA dioxygenase family protein [Actinobacteria bacterium]|nr:phytanoyl-CoA dioxygenase family protein [Actinomycetota bacterium]